MRFALLGSVWLFGCALPQVVPEASGELIPTGEVLFSAGSSASFDGARVSSPEMSLSRRTDGSWGGIFQGQPFDVSVTPIAARGVGVVLTLEDDGAGVMKIIGQWHGRTVRYELAADHIAIRSHSHSFDLSRDALSASGREGELKLKGQAGEPHPPWPQIGFALLAVFN
jgi:hypothetical protein